MSVLEPEPGDYDINFRLFHTPVRITPGFWVLHSIIGLILTKEFGIGWGIFWVAAVTGSILLHEFGHVFVGRHFGATGEIVLTVLGGLAMGSADLHHRSHRVAVYLAGPLAQLGFAGLLWLGRLGAEQTLSPGERLPIPLWLGLSALIAINVHWPLFNLIPVPPLDGGRVVREYLESLRPGGTAPWEQDPNWWKRR